MPVGLDAVAPRGQFDPVTAVLVRVAVTGDAVVAAQDPEALVPAAGEGAREHRRPLHGDGADRSPGLRRLEQPGLPQPGVRRAVGSAIGRHEPGHLLITRAVGALGLGVADLDQIALGELRQREATVGIGAGGDRGLVQFVAGVAQIVVADGPDEHIGQRGTGVEHPTLDHSAGRRRGRTGIRIVGPRRGRIGQGDQDRGQDGRQAGESP